MPFISRKKDEKHFSSISWEFCSLFMYGLILSKGKIFNFYFFEKNHHSYWKWGQNCDCRQIKTLSSIYGFFFSYMRSYEDVLCCAVIDKNLYYFYGLTIWTSCYIHPHLKNDSLPWRTLTHCPPTQILCTFLVHISFETREHIEHNPQWYSFYFSISLLAPSSSWMDGKKSLLWSVCSLQPLLNKSGVVANDGNSKRNDRYYVL